MFRDARMHFASFLRMDVQFVPVKTYVVNIYSSSEDLNSVNVCAPLISFDFYLSVCYTERMFKLPLIHGIVDFLHAAFCTKAAQCQNHNNYSSCLQYNSILGQQNHISKYHYISLTELHVILLLH